MKNRITGITDLAALQFSDVGQYYDKMGPFYECMWGTNLHVGFWPQQNGNQTLSTAQNNLTDLFIKYTPWQETGRVLDLGCGLGQPAIRLAEKTNCRVVGITISASQVKRANALAQSRNLTERVQFSYINGMDLAFPDGVFDTVWALESIFHMPNRKQVLQEVKRVLRPGGRLILTDLAEKPSSSPLRPDSLLTHLFQIQSLVRLEEYKQLIQEVGFRVRKIKDISQNIEPTVPGWKTQIALKQDYLVQVYGDSFMAMVNSFAPKLEEDYLNHISYIFIIADKAVF